MKRQALFFFLTVLLLVAGIAIFQLTLPPKINGVIIDPPKPMPDFTLQSAEGPVNLGDFRGKIVVLYFGYLSCPDVCPTTLAALREALNQLGAKAQDAQVIFVSVDYGRDTPEKARDYATNFHPDFLGLAGSKEQVDAVTKDFGIYYLINPPDENGFYTVDHTATVQVLNPAGELIMTWPYGIQPDEIASDLKVLLGR
ncbi:MAG: SCO family protein [Chloroflexi bacterium]|nr:MAG: SCO family protein [Chloroflexota bacterium]